MKNMKEEALKGFDISKKALVVAIAESGRDGEVSRFEHLHICYLAGSTGYGL